MIQSTSTSSLLWANNQLFSKPDLYELTLCHNYNVYLDFITSFYPEEAELLYAGCGTGRMAKLVAESGRNITACDINEKSLEFARNVNAHQRATYKQEDIGQPLPFASASFDGVFLLNNTFRHLLHLSEVETHLTEVNRCLKPGGVYISHLSLNHGINNTEGARTWNVNLVPIGERSNTSQLSVHWAFDQVDEDYTYETIEIKNTRRRKSFKENFKQRNWKLTNLVDILRRHGFTSIQVFDIEGQLISLTNETELDAFVVCKKG